VSIAYVAASDQPPEWVAGSFPEKHGLPKPERVGLKIEHMHWCEDDFELKAVDTEFVHPEPGAIMAGDGFQAAPEDLHPGPRTTLIVTPRMIGPNLSELVDYWRGQIDADMVAMRALTQLHHPERVPGGRAAVAELTS
jgi:hypothetical protein